ncbi:hypothetical protein ACYTFC_06735 [Streptomyces globosus]|uniref:hypothetical protein n=1 Tax=Streptomyces TaxID=1883 RepID=UPI000F73D344|nr:hypothetical protein [Streptomyces sp. WAC05292]RSS96276.1 hypothetical protein EF903_03320 [Streptomyces sp. WAC05292]
MEFFEARLQEIRPTRRLEMAVEVLDWTFESFGSIETDDVREYIETALRIGRDGVAAHHEKLELPDDMLEGFGEVEENADESGTSHLLSAILACSEAPGGLTGEVLYGVLSFCYEGILDREEIPEWTLESEAANRKCVAAIEFQKSKISEYLNHAH